LKVFVWTYTHPTEHSSWTTRMVGNDCSCVRVVYDIDNRWTGDVFTTNKSNNVAGCYVGLNSCNGSFDCNGSRVRAHDIIAETDKLDITYELHSLRSISFR